MYGKTGDSELNIWDFQKTVSLRLLRYNLVNIAAGLLVQGRSPFWKGIGSQAVGWGIINIAIAFFGNQAAQRRQKSLTDANTPDKLNQEASNLRRLLWLNAGLDLLYMLGGWQLTHRVGKTRLFRVGTGWGIIIQGALLLVFDGFHAIRVPDSANQETDRAAT